MALVTDILMLGGVLAAALYCMVLSRRLRQLSRLDEGMGAAIAGLSRQVAEMTRTLAVTRAAATGTAGEIDRATARAEAAARRVELLLATLNDLPPPYGREDRDEATAGRVAARRASESPDEAVQ